MTEPDLRVNIAGVELKNPVIPASGVFGFGREYAKMYDPGELGAIAAKGITPKRRNGNPPPRICETPSGMINAVGLQNPGIDAFIRDEIPFMRQFDTKIICNISGFCLRDYEEMSDKINEADVDMVELNLSCPNVKEGGMAMGTDPGVVSEVVGACRRKISKMPMFVKLSPNVTDIVSIAKAAEGAGADGISATNTFLGMRIDVNTRRPMIRGVMGGLSGPAIFPISLRMVYQIAGAVGIPVIGIGGIATGEMAAEMMLAGASAVGLGAVVISDPYAPIRIRDELSGYLKKNGFAKVTDIIGNMIKD